MLGRAISSNINNNSIFSAEQLSGIDLTPIYSADNPKPGAYALSVVAPGFSVANGWMMVRYVCTTVPEGTASQYSMAIHDGSVNNMYSFRMLANSSRPNCQNLNNRAAGQIKHSGTVGLYTINAHEVRSAIFVWRADGYQYVICDDTMSSSTETDARGMALTTLQIGGRNGGNDALVGRVLYAEIGNTYITPEQAAARMAVIRKPFVVESAGQSNIANWISGAETSAPAGRASFMSTLIDSSALNCPGEIVYLSGAEGGSSLYPEIDARHWITDTGFPGTSLIKFFAKQTLTGLTPDIVLWDQGEADAIWINHPAKPHITKENYKSRLLRTFLLMKERNPRLQIAICNLGIRTVSPLYGGQQAIVEAQNELIAAHSWIHFGYNRFDLALHGDGVHYLDASYAVMGGRAGRRVQALLGYDVAGGSVGPRLLSAARAGTALTITISHDAGTDFTPATAIQGFSYKDASGADVALSSVARANASTITATLASAVAGTLYYIYDNATISDLTKLVKDNGANALPLSRGKVTVA